MTPPPAASLAARLRALDDRSIARLGATTTRMRSTAGGLRTVFSVERRLLAELRPFRREVTVGLLLTVAITAVGLAQPWPTKLLVDDVLGDGGGILGLGRDASLVLTVALTVAVFLAGGALGLLQTRVLFGLAQTLVSELRERTFAHLTRVSLRFHDERATGDSVYRITNDTYAVQSVLLDGIVPLASALLAVTGTLVLLFALDPTLAGLALVSVPVAAVATRRFTRRITSAATTVQERESAVYAYAEQTVSSMRTVQSFGRGRHESARFAGRTAASRLAMMKLITLQTVFGLVIDLVLAIGLALVTYVAARRALSGQLQTGEVLVVIAYAGGLYGPVAGVAALIGTLKASAAAAARVFEVLDEPGVTSAGSSAAPGDRARGEVRLHRVGLSYTPGRPVLHDVDLSLSPGRLVALVGRTGAGKSSLAALLVRLYDPDAGEVTLDGVNLRALPLDWLRAQVAVVPQEPILFPGTIRENIRYGRLEASDDEVLAAARAANLDEILSAPEGLDLAVGDRGSTLSGGQRQRIALARAFVKDAPVVVLDEPTSALDATTEALVMDAVARLTRDRAVLVVAHRLSTVHAADEVVVLQGGSVVQRGTHRDLSRTGGPYRVLHEARFGRQPGQGTVPLPMGTP